jgi:hypothetical protein
MSAWYSKGLMRPLLCGLARAAIPWYVFLCVLITCWHSLKGTEHIARKILSEHGLPLNNLKKRALHSMQAAVIHDPVPDENSTLLTLYGFASMFAVVLLALRSPGAYHRKRVTLKYHSMQTD